MDNPMTLKVFLVSLVVCVVVALIPVGYAWTTITSQMENVEVKLRGLDQKLEQLQACQLAEGRALANTDRIKTADERVTELDLLLQQCAQKLRTQEAQPSSPEAGK